MAVATSNRLLPLLAGGVLLLLVFVSLKTCSRPEENAVALESVPSAPAPDADSPADTIKTLTANVAAMISEVQQLRRDNTDLRKENQTLIANRSQIEESVATRLRKELLADQHGDANQTRIDAGVLTTLTDKVDNLAEAVTHLQSGNAGSDIPVGLGLDGVAAPGGLAAQPMTWVEPLDRSQRSDTDTRLLGQAGQAEGYLDGAPRGTARHTQTAKGGPDPLQNRPVYTVPRNATLIGSTAMSALVGRIPIQGQVRDPMPFKVITGAENLAANGLTVPGVQGMVWSGTAVGDWTLSCVTGRLESVTFVFDDGTIRTISSDDRQGQGDDKPLGWISDAQGIPCISGERKTNAAAFLAQRIGIKAIEAAADAAAAAEKTAVVSGLGSVSDSVTGDVGTYVLGKTVAGGSDDVAKWLLERQSQSFDAVFVPAGVALAIHVDRELPIDFNPTGRKLAHAQPTDTALHSALD